MTARTKASASDEIARIEALIGDLEKRLRRLDSSARSEATGAKSDVSQFVNEALAGIMERMRDNAETATGDVADHAMKIGTDAYKRIAHEIEFRPMATIAIAAGIGFLFGLSRR